MIVPADDLSRQALAAQAEDMAVEDCLLVLEKAMLQGKIEPDVYLKQVGIAAATDDHQQVRHQQCVLGHLVHTVNCPYLVRVCVTVISNLLCRRQR